MSVLTQLEFYRWVLWGMMLIAPIIFIVLLFVTAPYGRYERQGWGPCVTARTGWFVMEVPASIIMLMMFVVVPLNTPVFLLLSIWQVHYFHRAFIYPFRLNSKRLMPVVVVGLAIIFNTINAYLNGFHFVFHHESYRHGWLYQPNFIAGLMVFTAGYFIAKKSDQTLANLRTDGEAGYRIPHGFMYKYISCPNYFGEIVQWSGWALMTLSPAGAVFCLWTLANLVPRAISHHKWYQLEFVDYPSDRKAIIPLIL